jgi:transketolase
MINFIKELRQEIMRVAVKNKRGHIAPSLSCLEILTVLHYEPFFAKDKVILSKGHGCYGLYAIYAHLGRIAKETWENFQLSGCLDGFGSLGHGLPIAVGIAYGKKLQKKEGHVFCIVGDGEMQEGSNWEALSFINHHKLNNITVIVDNNGLQAMDKIENVLSHNLSNRFTGWGFKPITCDGHNYMELLAVLKSKPQVVIANTIKGKGVPEMEGVAKWHYRLP